MTIGFGFVGCGGAAVPVRDAIDDVPDARLVAAFDRDPALAADLVRDSGATVHGDLESLLGDDGVDAVYIGLPHDLLAPTARRALEAGRHVLAEKPMALTVEDVLALHELASSRRLALGVVFELREVGAIRAARELIAAGAIGDITQIRARILIDKPPGYWASGPAGRVVDDWRGRRDRSGGGIVLMNGIHHLDLIQHLTGRRITRAVAEVGDPPPGFEVEEVAAAVLRLEGGAIGSVSLSSASPGASADERIELDGRMGRLDLPDPYEGGPLRLYLRRASGGFAPDVWQSIDPPTTRPYSASLAAFSGAVREGRPAPVGAPEAAAALAAVLAIYRSGVSGRAVDVDLDRLPVRSSGPEQGPTTAV